jgi:hypothetical protein
MVCFFSQRAAAMAVIVMSWQVRRRSVGFRDSFAILLEESVG